MVDFTPQFLACLPDTLAQECPYPNDWSNPANFSNTPGDPGGATMDGIIQSEFNEYCQVNRLPYTSVLNCPQTDGYTIFFQNYWLPYCPKLPPGLNLEYFDSDVNEGPTEATRILQVALGVTNDGIFGTETQAAVNNIPNLDNVINVFTARRQVVYRETSGFNLFGTDWIRRAIEIGQQSLAMANGTKLAPLAPYGLGTLLKRPIRPRYYLEGLIK
jgi:lysozyme family protein